MVENSDGQASQRTGFVNRIAELDLIEDLLHDAVHGRAPLRPIVCLHGVRGIGKTCLIQHLSEQARENGQPATLIDFARLNPDMTAGDVYGTMAQTIIDQVGSLAPDRPDDGANRSEDRPSQESDRTLVQVLVRVAVGRPLLLLFDSTEQAPVGVLERLEYEVIAPLLQTERAVIVLAGRKPVSWDKFDVSQRTCFHQLEPFTTDHVGAQLPSYASLANSIANMTGGHPLANDEIAQGIRELEAEMNTTFNQEDFERYKWQLLQYLFDRLITKQIMRDVDSDVRQALKVVAILRHFEINGLRYLLTSFDSPQFEKRSATYYLELIGKMVDSGLVKWDQRQKGYAVDRAIRRIMFLHKAYDDLDGFDKMNEAAAGLYALWIEKLPDSRIGSIIERLFHLGSAEFVGHRPTKEQVFTDVAFKLRSELQGYLERYYAGAEFGLTCVRTLREELHADTEFQELMPEIWGALTQFIDRYERSFIRNQPES